MLPQSELDAAFGGIAEGLADISLDSLLCRADEADISQEPTRPASKRSRIPLDRERRHDSRVSRSRFVDARQIAAAAAILAPLPRRGEVCHIVMSGNFHLWTFVPSLIALIDPAVIESLYVATLGFNASNSDSLANLIDCGKVRAVTFLASHYFKNADAPVYEYAEQALSARGQRITAARSHAKILAAQTSDGAHYVIESSANLRSCNNIEQATVFNDAALFDFHQAWIDDVFRTADSADAPTADEV